MTIYFHFALETSDEQNKLQNLTIRKKKTYFKKAHGCRVLPLATIKENKHFGLETVSSGKYQDFFFIRNRIVDKKE